MIKTIQSQLNKKQKFESFYQPNDVILIRYLTINSEKKLLFSWLFSVFRLQLEATPSTCRDACEAHKKQNRKLRTFHCLACAWLTPRLRTTQKVWDSTLLVAFMMVNMTIKHESLLSTRNNWCLQKDCQIYFQNIRPT